MSDLCRLGTRFVHSNLEAFNLALHGPTVFDRLDLQTVEERRSSIFLVAFTFHGVPAYFSAIGVHEVHGVNGEFEGRNERGP